MPKDKILQDDFRQMIWLAAPMFVEIVLRTLMGNIDQFMLSRYSATAVAAVGNANQIMNMMMLVLNVVCIASTITIAQYIGANRTDELPKLYMLTLSINIPFSILLSSILFFQKPVLHLMKLPEALLEDTSAYFTIVAGGFVFRGIFMSFSAILCSNAMMKEIMMISMVSNLVNVFGNACLIHGIGWIPPLGVRGAAISTVSSLFVSICLSILVYKRKIAVPLQIKYIKKLDLGQMFRLLRLGIPAAGDSISYNTMQLVMFSFINSYGTLSATAKAYVSMVVIFVYMCSSSIAQANQIKVGYLVGAGKAQRAKKLVSKSVKVSIVLSFMFAVLLYHFSDLVFSVFTTDEQILSLIKQIVFVDVFLELGRAVNMVMINSLLAAGDTKFPVICAVFSMWTVAVPVGYVCGTILGYGVAGVWIGLALDEWCRAVAFIIRWKSNRWQKKCVVV